MKKKIIALVLSLFLVLSITGCGKEDPIDRLKNSFNRSLEMVSASQSFDMDLSVDISGDDPQMAMMGSMFENINISGAMDIIQKDMSFAGNVKIDLNGMAYNMEIFKGEEYFIKIPFSPKYVIIADKEDSAEMFDNDFIQSFSKEGNDLITSKFTSENVTAKEEITIEQNGEQVKVTPIDVTLTEEDAKLIFKELMELMLENPEYTDQIKKSMKQEIKDVDEEKTEEEIEEMYEETMAEMDEMFKAAKEAITLTKMDFTYYLDKNDDVRKSDIDYLMVIDMAKISEDSELPIISIGITGSSDIYNINKIQEIEYPELNEENSTDLEGMMGLPIN